MSGRVLSKIVRDRREELDITQEELAKSLGVSRQTISKWENGYVENMSIEKLAAYSEILDLPIIAFVYPESYMDMDQIEKKYIDLAKKMQDNQVSIRSAEYFIELVADIKLNIFKDLQ